MCLWLIIEFAILCALVPCHSGKVAHWELIIDPANVFAYMGLSFFLSYVLDQFSFLELAFSGFWFWVLDVSEVFFAQSDLYMRHAYTADMARWLPCVPFGGVTEELFGNLNELCKPDIDGVLESKGVESVSGDQKGVNLVVLCPLKSSHLVPSMEEFGWVEAKDGKVAHEKMNVDGNVVVNEASTPLNDVANKKIEPVVVTYNLRRTWRKFDAGEMSLDEETGIWLFKLKSEISLHGTPFELWNGEGINNLASGVGKPIMLDFVTKERCLNKDWEVSYARVLVEVNADRELPKGVEAKPRSEEELAKKKSKELLEMEAKKLNEKEKFDGSWNVVRRRRFQNRGMGYQVMKTSNKFEAKGDVSADCHMDIWEEQKRLVNYWLELKSEPPDHIKGQWSNSLLDSYAHCDIQRRSLLVYILFVGAFGVWRLLWSWVLTSRGVYQMRSDNFVFPLVHDQIWYIVLSSGFLCPIHLWCSVDLWSLE
ncbi:hypothetical protein L6452_01225 [Arctium lappa]|uniref:Uncharacterized protein n=1 Tax=Arctium lappa TaxID=4217 RepID=A0ACB9FG70_ARCLA|nr:hypothetical protein L6452_01225 [Arctium lappa]